MRRKGIFTILAAVFMVLSFSAMAFAANQVFLKTTVPNIPKSTCYQAGTDTMEFDSLSSMREGDYIEFTLNNKVTVCKDINWFVTFANTAGTLDLTGALPASTTAGTITAAAGGQQWGFVVQGAVGSQIIRLTLRQVITATGVLAADTNLRMTFTGTALTDKFVVKLFDGKGVGTFATSGIQKWNTTTTAYDTAIVAQDNALCIDTLTQDYQGEYVQNTPNSVPELVADKLNFSGDYTIAHIMAPQTYALVTCKGATCGSIPLGSTTQAAATCVAFDYETLGTGANGYCSDHTAYTGYLPKFVIQSSQQFELVPYTVTAEILVNGVAGERGVYWSNVAPAYKTSSSTTCGTAVGAVGFAGQTYYRGDGTTIAVPVAPIAGACAGVAAAAKAVKFVTTAGALFAAGDMFFELNLPAFNYNLAEVAAGSVVTVRVTLAKQTCGNVVTLDLCMGTFVATCPVTAGSTTITCPYVTSIAPADSWWNGLALTNTMSQPVTFAITAYKGDGTTATATETVAAKGTVAKLVSAFTWTGTAPVGVPAYITAVASGAATVPAGSVYGFVMMADGTHNSMGYLCKP